MRKILNKYYKEIIMLLGVIILGILFFSYNIAITWDSSEYLGLAEQIGKKQMQQNWIGHRGIGFPLLIKIFEPFGIKSSFLLLILMFIFYIGLVSVIYTMFKKVRENYNKQNKMICIIFGIYTVLFILLNPIIFGYYHIVLTEFVAITITLVICYLVWKWNEFNWKENKKQIIIYAIIFAVLTILLYHVKQSFLPLALIPILTASFISIITKFKWENFIIKIVTLAFVLIMLVISIIIWNISMGTAKVVESTNNTRVRGYFVKGINGMIAIGTQANLDKIDRTELSNKDNEIIDKILNGESKYKKFTIYKTPNDKMMVYYTKRNYSLDEELKFYIKVWVNEPLSIIKSYNKNYKKVILWTNEFPIWLSAENNVIPLRIYNSSTDNIIGVNPEYEQYIQEFKKQNYENSISRKYNKYVYKCIKFMNVFLKFSLWAQPVSWIISIIAYIVLKNKIRKETLKILELTLILYTTSFLGIMSYVVPHAIVDRYIIPMVIPTFLAQFFAISLLYKIKSKK